jgi:PhnB protein
MTIQPYLFFEGRCDEALAFYKEALGAEVTALMRYKEAPDQPPEGACGQATGEHVMHASFKVGDTEVLVSDGMASGKPEFRGFALTLVAPNEAEARKRFEALARDGTVQMPLGRTFFSPCFGMVADRFGLGWMIIVL